MFHILLVENGVCKSIIKLFLFHLLFLDARGVVRLSTEKKICTFLGDILFALACHHPNIYFYVAWVGYKKGIVIIKSMATCFININSIKCFGLNWHKIL